MSIIKAETELILQWLCACVLCALSACVSAAVHFSRSKCTFNKSASFSSAKHAYNRSSNHHRPELLPLFFTYILMFCTCQLMNGTGSHTHYLPTISISISGFCSHRMIGSTPSRWLNLLACLLLFLKTEGLFVEITYVTSAVAKGAVCLDGSPPAYHLDRGSGTGINNWLVHFEGGGWCNNVTSCLERKNTRLGSSRQMDKEIAFSGIMSNAEQLNPDFHNWNRVKIRYCDGSSFTGDVQAVNPATNLHFRGARIWLAVVEDLLAKGMKNAKNALLSGCSAGGLASILHCDSFRALLPVGTKAKCLSDAGYFINTRDISGAPHIQSYFSDVVTTHGSTKNLPPSCTSRLKPSLCFFPQYVASQIQTPLFVLNAAYDSWQIRNILAPGVDDPSGSWKACKLDISNCSPVQLNIMQDFRLQFLSTLYRSANSPARGLYIDSCFIHCQTEKQETWFMADSPRLKNTKIAKAVGDWFYDRTPFRQIDCPYPCNPTCLNREIDHQLQPER